MARKKEHKNRSVTPRTLVVIGSIFMVSTCLLMFMFTRFYSFGIQEKVNDSIIYASCGRAKATADSYLRKLEGIVKNIFSKEAYVKYDCTAAYDSSSDGAAREKEITEYLAEVSVMDEYAEFGIIYRNNHHLGVVSDSTMSSLSNDVGNTFDTVEKILGDSQQTWYCDADNENGQVFLFRRANSNAVLIVSFYKSQFKNILSESLPDEYVSIYLTDSDYNILYSSKDDLGKLNDDYLDAFDGSRNCVASEYNFVAAIKPCVNDWNVVVSLDIRVRTNQYKRMTVFCASILISALVIFWLVSLTVCSAKNEFVKRNVLFRPESIDKLTGLSNAETAENLIADKIERCVTGSTIMLAIIRVSNYTLIKENYGEAGANEALLKTADALQEFYDGENIVGKISENEFIVFSDFTQYDLFVVHNNIKTNLSELEDKLSQIVLDDDRGDVKYNIGAAVYPDNSDDYDELYDLAKEALARSMESDRGHYAMFSDKEDGKGKI